MAASKPNKDKSGSRLAKVDVDSTNELHRAAIFTVKEDGTINSSENRRAGVFLINPSTWEETKSANWVQHAVPGQSDPVLQWISSGPRTVTFTALVTKETSDLDNTIASNQAPNPLNQALSFIGDIASSFFKISVPPPRQNNSITGTPQTLDISEILDFYRSLLYPVYDTSKGVPNKLKSSPPLVVLLSGKTLTRIPFDDKISTDTDVWVVTNLRIRTTKQLPNLAPLEAEVEFQLTQYTIRSFDRNRFIS